MLNPVSVTKAIAVFLAVMTLFGCNVRPDYVPPTGPETATLQFASEANSAPEPPVRFDYVAESLVCGKPIESQRLGVTSGSNPLVSGSTAKGVAIEANRRITILAISAALVNECGVAASFVPQPSKRYLALFRSEGKSCSLDFLEVRSDDRTIAVATQKMESCKR